MFHHSRRAAAATAALAFTAQSCAALEFTVANGQIYTPGLVVVNSPQPGTPLGGDFIEISLDVSTNGRLPLPPYPEDNPTQIYGVNIFLYSYDTGKNFTIANGEEHEASANDGGVLGDIMLQEPGSTVKHIKWVWPDCLVGDGEPTQVDSARGIYNISIRQNFRLNDEDHYTIFDLPISVTNSIQESDSRPACSSLENELLTPQEIAYENNVPVMFAPGDATTLETFANAEGADGDGLGPVKGDGSPAQGLGPDSGAGRLLYSGGATLGLLVFSVVAGFMI